MTRVFRQQQISGKTHAMNVIPRKARLATFTVITARVNLSRHKMNLIGRISLLYITLICVENKIYLQETKDALAVEFYDCVPVQSLFYCRRPHQPFDLIRENDTTACHDNGGRLHRFSELQSKNIDVSTVLHQWRSSIERVDQYARFRQGGAREWDGYLCQCIHPSAFGKNCEYRLPVGNTFDQTLQWQLGMRTDYPWKVQEYGDVVCYERVGCDSGLLCLDWREICDGVQQCMSGVDEEHCDLLEMNRCDDEDEYRCMNGMCIPDQFFLDGEMDCLDWSDELQSKNDGKCYLERASSECDDRVCPPTQWSCGDGQCIHHRLAFQTQRASGTCDSQRDQYFMCETHGTMMMWTMRNGRCFGGKKYHESLAVHDNEEQLCEYLLKCTLSKGVEENCSCNEDLRCVNDLQRDCLLSLIPYPRGALVAPFMFFFYNLTRSYVEPLPDFVLINGTVRCRDSFVRVTQNIPFEKELDARRITEDLFCVPTRNISSAENVDTDHQCHRANESTDRCNEWNPCMSTSRLKDGWKNCLNGRDELHLTEVEIKRSCSRVRRHRFRCSIDQSTCLSVTTLGDQKNDCENRFDEVWFGHTGRKLSDIHCNDQSTDECSLLRQYLEQSWTSTNRNGMRAERRIAFRFYCDTFWNLDSGEDEDLEECRRWWTCPDDQWRCQNGQCIDKRWRDDGDWDCADASDAHGVLKNVTERILQQALEGTSDSQGYSVPTTCNKTRPFLCPSPQASRERFSCISLDQIGDQHIDCAGAMDEPNTLTHCSHSSTMLGHNFRCLSTNTCIPYWLHCSNNNRCPNRSDDEHWCDRPTPTWSPITPRDALCFDGQVFRYGRCNGEVDCQSGEDEYMCDIWSSFQEISVPYREWKESRARSVQHTLRLPRYPTDTNITLCQTDSPFPTPPADNSSSLSPFWCNRGLGAFLSNGSIVCFCPPQYFGDKCQYQADRVSLLLSLDLSQSIYHRSNNDPATLLRVLLLFFFENQTLMTHQFHLRPAVDVTIIQKTNKMKKMITHFLYPHSSAFRDHRLQRLNNRSHLIHTQPFSIGIEIYETRRSQQQPTLVAVWRYPISFDHLPVFRLAKVLRLPGPLDRRNPCSSRPCHHEHEECHPVINDHPNYVCLCKTNFTGQNCSQEDPRCLNGYCASGSLCKPSYRGLLRGEDSDPLCLCPLDRFGDRCSIEHDGCLSHPCLNGGSCFPHSQPDQLTCVCARKIISGRNVKSKDHISVYP